MKTDKIKVLKVLPLLIVGIFFLCSCAVPAAENGTQAVLPGNDENIGTALLSVANDRDKEPSMSTGPDDIIPTSLLDVLSQPNGMIETEDDVLLVTDLYNRAIWKVKDGKSEIYAGFSVTDDLYGQPVGGYNDSALEKSSFKTPWAIAPFLDGYAVSDSENNVIRLIRESGVETVNAHTETGANATEFNHPTGLAADEDGNLYVAETFSDRIRMIAPDGTVTTVVSGVSEPTGLCIKDGALYIAESGADRISVFKDGNLSVLAGSGQSGYKDGSADNAEFSSPQGIAAGDDGTVYVSDTANSAIRIIKDGTVSTLIARDVTDINEFFPIEPTGLLISDNLLYVCDPYARKLLTIYI